jgi:hypothetical protein
MDNPDAWLNRSISRICRMVFLFAGIPLSQKGQEDNKS